MSHFAVLVVGEDVEGQLAPYHEFECTGRNDQYVQEVDKTDKTMADYKEWRERHPEDDEPFAEWACDWHGLKLLHHGEQPDTSDEGEHKYGWVQVDENGQVVKVVDRTNPDARWDWYQIGGRFRGYFLLKDDVDISDVVVGEPGAFENLPRHHADQCRKFQVDVEGMRRAAGEEAGARWDRYWAVAEGTPQPVAWEAFVEAVKEGRPAPALVAAGGGQAVSDPTGDPLTIEEARRLYWNQPRLVALKEHDAACAKEKRWEDTLLGIYGGAEDYAETREQHVQNARDMAISTFAFVHEGKWVERGKMGWWAMVSDEADGPTWGRAFSEWFDGLPEDTLLTVVDCHI